MITTFDTSILLDILIPDEVHRLQSLNALNFAAQDGALVICEAVYAELASNFSNESTFQTFLEETGILLLRSASSVLVAAGRAWTGYVRQRPSAFQCPRCGSMQQLTCHSWGERFRGQQHLLPDFLIGAHAEFHGDRLLTRDRGFYRTYFQRLTIA